VVASANSLATDLRNEDTPTFLIMSERPIDSSTQAWTGVDQRIQNKLSKEDFRRVADARRDVYVRAVYGQLLPWNLLYQPACLQVDRWFYWHGDRLECWNRWNLVVQYEPLPAYLYGLEARIILIAAEKVLKPSWLQSKHLALSALVGCSAGSYLGSTYRGAPAIGGLADSKLHEMTVIAHPGVQLRVHYAVFQKTSAGPTSYRGKQQSILDIEARKEEEQRDQLLAALTTRQEQRGAASKSGRLHEVEDGIIYEKTNVHHGDLK
jgi:hypothetical protein